MREDQNSKDVAQPISLNFDFRRGFEGWETGFSDYSTVNEELELEARLQVLPPELNDAEVGLFIQGINRSDDLFMYLKRQLSSVEGIKAGQVYQVKFRLVFASNSPSNCAGAGGTPGESVFLKAGASAIEPIPFLNEDGQVRMNVDKGNQSESGAAASVVSNIANGIPCDSVPDLDAAPYVSLTRLHEHKPTVTTSEDGTLWLLVGTESGLESLTALYYQQIEVELVPAFA